MRTATAVAAATMAMVVSSCTYQLRDPGIIASCDALVFEINTHQAGIGNEQYDAIIDAFDDYGALVGREVIYNGTTTGTYTQHSANDPVLVELTWPEEAPEHLGYAEPEIVDGKYVSGWMYLNPAIGTAPAPMVRRLVLHELGHMTGLNDVWDDPNELMNPALTVDNFGPGDTAGFTITHNMGCTDNQLATNLNPTTGDLAQTTPTPEPNSEAAKGINWNTHLNNHN